jgi:hypothetical protein
LRDGQFNFYLGSTSESSREVRHFGVTLDNGQRCGREETQARSIKYQLSITIGPTTPRKTVVCSHVFRLKGVDTVSPPVDYEVVTDEELIEGLSFSIYHRLSTAIIVPLQSQQAFSVETVPITTFSPPRTGTRPRSNCRWRKRNQQAAGPGMWRAQPGVHARSRHVTQ